MKNKCLNIIIMHPFFARSSHAGQAKFLDPRLGWQILVSNNRKYVKVALVTEFLDLPKMPDLLGLLFLNLIKKTPVPPELPDSPDNSVLAHTT